MRKSNACLCAVVVPQLLRKRSRAAGEVTGYSPAKLSREISAPAQLRDPLGPLLELARKSASAQQKTCSPSPACQSPAPEGAGWARWCGREAAGWGASIPRGSREPAPAAPSTHTPRKPTNAQCKGTSLPSDIAVQRNGTEGGKANTQRTKGQS